MNTEKYNQLKTILDTLKTGGCSNIDSHGEIFEEVLDIVKPKHILEIGFFCGGSAGLFLNLCDAKLTSIDPIDDNPTTDYLKSVGKPEEIGPSYQQLAAAQDLQDKYKDRFNFIKKRSLSAALDGDLKDSYELAFIDGDHWEAGVTIDLNIVYHLKIPFILLDDFNETYNGVRQAFSKMQNKFLPIKLFKKDGADAMFAVNKDVVKVEFLDEKSK